MSVNKFQTICCILIKLKAPRSKDRLRGVFDSQKSQ